MSTGTRRLDLEEVGDVTVAKFIDKKILDEGNIQIIGNQLFALIEEDGRQKIVLDFSNVEYLSSAALGKLITMDKKVKAAKGQTAVVRHSAGHLRSLRDHQVEQAVRHERHLGSSVARAVRESAPVSGVGRRRSTTFL